MDEQGRRATPRERGLAVPQPDQQDRFQFTPAQLNIIQDRVLQYLRNHHLPFNQQAVQEARAILGIDAVERALLQSGRTDVQPKDNVRTLIREGLKLREDVHIGAKEALDALSGIPAIGGSLRGPLGPYAYDSGMADAAAEELAQFSRTPNITDAEKLAMVYKYRKHALPQFAAVAVGEVSHDQFPQASLEQFPSANDQAKLVRNMLISQLYRRSLSPVISIEELRECISKGTDLRQFLANNDVVSAVMQKLPVKDDLPQSVYEDYLSDLILQIQVAFYNFRNPQEQEPEAEVTHEQIIFERDKLYRSFTPTLLLLHPALEERPIIVNPDKAEAADYSLWREDLSIVMGGQRVPTFDALYRAGRLTAARGYSTARFDEGVKAWRSYSKAREREAKQIAALQTEIAKNEARKQRVLNGGKLPPVAFVLTRAEEHASEEQRQAARAQFKNNLRLVTVAKNDRADVEAYAAELRDTYKGKMPDELPTPSSMARKLTTEEKTRKSYIKTYNARAMEKSYQLFQEDAFASKDMPEILDEKTFSALSVDEVNGEIASLQERIAALEDPSVPLPEHVQEYTYGDLMRYIHEYSDKLQERTTRTKRSTEAIKGDTQRMRDLAQLRKRVIQLHAARVPDPDIVRVFYQHELQNRVQIFQYSLDARERMAYANTATVVPSTLPKNEVDHWIRTKLVETIPSHQFTTEDLRKQLPNLQNFSQLLAGHMYPITLPTPLTRTTFDAWLEETMSGLNEVIGEHEAMDKVSHEYYTAKSRRKKLAGLRAIKDSPLLPFEEGKGLSEYDFLHAFAKRVRLVRALTMIEQSSQIYDEKNANLKQIVHDVYMESLDRKLQRTQGEVERLVDDPPSQRRLLETMQRLNLVKPEGELVE